MTDQAGLLYQLPADKISIGIQPPSTSQGLRLFKNTTTGNWETIDKDGVRSQFTPAVGSENIVNIWDASGDTYPDTGGSGLNGAIMKGDTFATVDPGIVGGNNYIRNGYLLTALVDTPGQTPSNWIIISNEATKVEIIEFAVGDEVTPLTTGNVFTFRAPYKLKILAFRASLVTAQVDGNILTFDVKNEADHTIFSTVPTIDNTEKTTVTAADPNVINEAFNAVGNDGQIVVSISQVGADSIAAGLKFKLYVAKEI